MLNNAQLAQNIKMMRVARGLGMRAVGDRLGVTYQRIGQMESGKFTLKVPTLLNLAEVYACSTSDLLDENLKTRIESFKEVNLEHTSPREPLDVAGA